jgi:5-methyltetrahydrofolate--homocysteine methyltransferase
VIPHEVDAIESICLIKQQIPYVKTVISISNISFGLPAAACQVVNSVFVCSCTKAGLDLAVVNAEKLELFASTPEEECRSAEAFLFNTPPATATPDHKIFALFETAPEGLAFAISPPKG